MTGKDLTAWVTTWKGAAALVALMLAGVGYDGRRTATTLATHLTQEVPALLDKQKGIDAVQDSVLDTVDALALSQCLRETNAIARIELNCGDRERRAGVTRR